jgi:acyl-CoA thioester hydrolase
MYTSEHFLRARYGETDQMGFVYYGNYASWYEVCRVESLRQLGMTYREMEAMGVMMPVLENHSKFLSPAFFYNIYNEDGKLIHEGETLLAFVDIKSGKPCRPPVRFMDCLEPFFK